MELSLIIPAYRDAALRRKLVSLAGQTFKAALFEVIVVTIGDEAKALTSAPGPWPFTMRLLTIPGAEAKGHYPISQKRNYGALVAEGKVLAFTDDDVLHPPNQLAGLQALFARGFHGIAVTDLIFEDHTVSRPAKGRFVAWTRLNGSLMAMDRPTYTRLGEFNEAIGRGGDLGSGYHAIYTDPSRERLRLGGEDLEFGYRAMRLGVPILRVPTTPAIHIGAPRTDFATGRTSGYQAFTTAERYGWRYAAAVGVHPLLLHLKALAVRLSVDAWIFPRRYRAYERGYLNGALEAYRERIRKSPTR